MSSAAQRRVLLGLYAVMLVAWVVAALFVPAFVPGRSFAVVGAAWSAFWIGRLL